MKPALKKLCIYGLAHALASSLVESSPKDRIVWRATKLQEAAAECVSKTKCKIDNSSLLRVQEKMNQLYPDGKPFDLTEAASFLLLGLNELMYFSKEVPAHVTLLYRRIHWLLEIQNPTLLRDNNHMLVWKLYQKWTE